MPPKNSEEAKKEAAKERLKATDYNLNGLHKMDESELEQYMDELYKEEFDGQLFKKTGGKYSLGNYSAHTAADKTGPIIYADRNIITHDGAVLNRLTPAYVKPEWLKFLEQQTGFFSLLLWAGAVLCFVGYALRRDVDNLYLGVVLAAVTFITGVFSYTQEGKAASLMAQFSKLLAQSIQCQTDMSFRAVEDKWDADGGLNFDPLYLVPGDVVRLKGGDKVPADIRILAASDFKVDNSPLTGEPDALSRTPTNTYNGDAAQDVTNIIFFGTDCKEGTATGLVIFTGDETYIGRIAKLTESTGVEQTPINKEIHHFILIVSTVAMVLGVTFFIVGAALGTDIISNLVFMIGIIVANVPEGLLATVTVCLTLTSKSMASKQVLVKNMEGVETLGSTTCICSDKTGTLTQNKMTFAELLYDGRIWRTAFVEEDKKAGYAPVDAEDATFRLFHRAMCLNTTAQFVPTDITGKRDRHNVDVFTEPPKPFFRMTGNIPQVVWDTKGDASESSIIKFAQFMHPDAAAGRTAYDPDDIMAAYDSDLMISSRSAFPAAIGGEIPFNSANKYHLKITENKGEDVHEPFTVWMKGAPEKITNRCSHHIVNGKRVPLTSEDRIEIDRLRNELMGKGRRVLAFAFHNIAEEDLPSRKSAELNVPVLDPRGVQLEDAHGKPMFEKKNVDYYFDQKVKNFPMGEDPTPAIEDPDHARLVSQKLTFLGMAALIDPPRPSVPDAVLSCQRAGIRVVMVTGDHPQTAAAIARMVNIFTEDSFKQVGPLERLRKVEDGEEVGVLEYDPCELDNRGQDVSSSRAIVVPGWEFTADTSDEKWRFIFSHDEIVFARTSPAQKLQIVERFQNMEDEIVAVTGDGVNDAPALKRANIGVAMGIAGTEVSKTAADMILLDDNFASIVNGVEEGRLIFDNLKKSIAYTLSSNIPEIAPFLVFITVRTPLPLSTVLILCIDLGTDMVPAISMAWENPESDIMRRPARDSNVDRLVTKKLVSFAYLQIGVIQALAGFFTWFVVMNDYGYPPHVLPGLGAFDNWGQQVLFCRFDGGQFRNLNGDVFTGSDGLAAQAAEFYFWDPAETGTIEKCGFAARNFDGESSDSLGLDILNPASYGRYTDDIAVVSLESLKAMHSNGYVEYYPWKGRESVFWENEWLNRDQLKSGIPGSGSDVADLLFFDAQLPGVFSVTQVAGTPTANGDEAFAAPEVLDFTESYFAGLGIPNGKDQFRDATFFQPLSAADTGGEISRYCYCTRDDATNRIFVNVASRQMQKEALHHAQCAYFVSIVIVQWADLLICKTRWLSIYHQGMRNPAMNFGLLFETILAAALCYLPGVDLALGTRPLRLLHWVPAMPFSIVIFLYDEVRKYIMRATSTPVTQGQQVIMHYGWLARNTYY